MTVSPRRRVTIQEVARAAGVNASTVSRVLNNRVSVRPETQRRIERAVEELGYRPSSLARSLASSQTWTIGMLLPDIQNLMHVEFLRGAQDVVQQWNYSLIICDGQLDPEIQARELERFIDIRVDGVIVSRAFTLTDKLMALQDAGIPVEPLEVFSGRREEELIRRRAASHRAYRTLFELGHRNIAMFIHERRDAPGRSPEMQSRIDALHATAAQLRLGNANIVEEPVAEPNECVGALARLLEGATPPTALIAGNDWMTAPLLSAVRQMRLDIPGDVSFLSYGDSQWTQALQIAVIRYDYRGEGAALASRVLGALGEDVDEKLASAPLAEDEFVARESLAPPRARR